MREGREREIRIFHERKKEIFNERGGGGRKREGLLRQREAGGSEKNRDMCICSIVIVYC